MRSDRRKWTARLAMFVVATAAVLAGCDKQTERKAPPLAGVVASAPLVPAPRFFTADDWRRSVLATYVESQAKDEGDGITSFMGCFDETPGKKCEALVFGKRDAFRKIRHYTSVDSQMASFTAWRYLFSYVALPDCEAPSYMMRAHFFSKGGWLFMNRAAVMADGEVIFERDLSKLKIDRNAESYGVEEDATFIASDSEIAALRKIAEARKVQIRLTGDKGYVSVKDEDTKRFISDVVMTLTIYDKLSAAAASASPTACS